VMLFHQLGAPSSLHRGALMKIREQIDDARAVLFLKVERMKFQLMNFDEHRDTPRPQPDTAKDAEARSEAQLLQGAKLRIKAVEGSVKERERSGVVGLFEIHGGVHPINRKTERRGVQTPSPGSGTRLRNKWQSHGKKDDIYTGSPSGSSRVVPNFGKERFSNLSNSFEPDAASMRTIVFDRWSLSSGTPWSSVKN